MNEQPETFEKKLKALINHYSLENGSDTPDFILAQYLNSCLQTFNTALKARDKWYGFKPFDDHSTTLQRMEKE